jgi:hypothetical protein
MLYTVKVKCFVNIEAESAAEAEVIAEVQMEHICGWDIQILSVEPQNTD